MSDQSQNTSVQEALPEIGEQVEQAVEGNTEDAAPAEGTSPTEQKAAEAQSTLKDPTASKAQKKAAERQLKKLKLKVDGEEFDEEFDLNDDKYLTEQLQLAKVARKRMQEKSVIEKEVINFIKDLQTNPRKALSDPAIGLDIKKLAADIIEEEIANSKKSPEQLAREKAETELKALKEEREREKEDAKQRELARLSEQEYERYDLLMSQALEKNELPKSPYIVKKMADYMLIALQEGKELTPEEIVPLVREELMEDIKQLFAAAPDEVMEQMIGKNRLDSYRKKNIAKAKKADTPAVKAAAKTPDTGKSSAKEEKPVEKKITFKDFFKV